MYTVYGIPNCDTVKKARNWLDAHKISYHFHNYKTDGITAARLKNWTKQVGWQTILNTKSSTWRDLNEATKAATTNDKAAIQLMLQNPSIIKRPVIEQGEEVVAVGFKVGEYEEKLG